MNNLTVIARENCIYCRLAIRLLEDKGLQFELLMLGIDFEREEFESLAPGAKTFSSNPCKWCFYWRIRRFARES